MSLDRRAGTSLREHWALFLVEGAILVVLGAAAIFLPFIALALAIFLGWILVISGVVGLATTLSMYRAPGFWWSVVSAATAIAAGLALSGWPLHVTLPIERVLVYFFVIEGIVSIIYAFDHKRAMSGRWAWMLACGLVDLALGGAILAGLAGAAERTTGTLVGISMLFGGVSLIAMALDARAIGR